MKGSLVITAMRNEGPFLLEWLAWYRMLGFADVLVMHNDCTDHSPQLLRLLERKGLLAQKRVRVEPGKPPQPQAHEAAAKHPLARAAEWCFVCDADEFLVIRAGDGSVSSLLERGDVPWAGMLINWRIFGTAGRPLFEDGLVHRQFTRAARPDAPQNSCFKALFRRPRDWGRPRAHGPKHWMGEGAWGAGGNHMVLSDGRPWRRYDPDPLNTHPPNSVDQGEIVHARAQVNHYAVRSVEQFAHKKGRASAALLEDRYTDDFFARFDRNEEEDLSALAYGARFDAAHAEICAIPGVMRLHHLCCADYVARMCEKRGASAAADPRWQHHMQQARALPRHAAGG